MRTRTILAAALLLAGIAHAADNPYAGTWKIDTPNSSWSDGKFPKNMSLVISMSFKGDEVTYHSSNDTNKNRPPNLVDYTAQMNWKPYPLTGAARYNMASVRMLSPTQMEVIELKDNNVIVARAAGKIYAFSLGCPHQNTSLRWNDDEKQFTCPKHKSHYRPDGTFIDGRATRDMDRLPVRKDAQTLVVDVDTLYQQDLNSAQWTAAFITG